MTTDSIYRVCINRECNKIWAENECLDWKHPSGERLCPDCHETTEPLEINACPYCGHAGEITAPGYCACSNPKCPSDCVIMTIREWQNRPIEDQYKAEIEFLRTTIAKLNVVLVWPDNKHS